MSPSRGKRSEEDCKRYHCQVLGVSTVSIEVIRKRLGGGNLRFEGTYAQTMLYDVCSVQVSYIFSNTVER